VAFLPPTLTYTPKVACINFGMSGPEPSIKRVWPTSLLTWSRLRRAVTSQLGTQGRHICCHTGVV